MNTRAGGRVTDKALKSLTANPADKPTVLVAALAAAAIGALMYNVLPLYLGAIEDGKSLASSQTGLIGTAFFLGFNIAGISAFAWIRRYHWRTTSLLSIPIMLGMLFLCVQWKAFPLLLSTTVICGIAFGVIYTIGSVIIGDTSRPERWYGLKVGLESAAGAGLMLALPITPLIDQGFPGLSAAMAVVIAILAPCLLLLPGAWQKDDTRASSELTDQGGSSYHQPVNRVAIGAAVLSLLCLFASVSAIWAFAERMGSLSGYDQSKIDTLLAATLICGIGGSLLVAALGDRVSAVLGFEISTVLIVLALGFLSFPGHFTFYALGNCLYMFAWAAATPCVMAKISRLDHDGRYVSLLAPAIGIGGMLGPGIAGWLLEVASLSAVLVYVASVITISGALMLVAARSAGDDTATTIAGEEPGL